MVSSADTFFRSASSLLLLAVSLLLAGCREAPERPPNIVLLTIDTQRWDYFGSYGYRDAGLTPTIDRLAARGTRFQQAVSVAGTTFPAHASMLTGLYPRQHGARSNYHALGTDIVSVAQTLDQAQYQTGAFVSFRSMLTNGHLNRGFQADNTAATAGQPKVVQSGEKTLQQANDWLRDTDPQRPLFLWLHLFEPHGPYDLTDYADQRLSDYDGLLRDGADMDKLLNRTPEIVNSEANLAALRTLYAGEVNLADRLIGRLLDSLDALGRLDDSVVILTSDHGQGLGEGRRMGHGAVLWEEVIRVPLIIADFREPRRAEVVTERVGVIDIAPTVADYANLPIAFDRFGRSLRNASDERLSDEQIYLAGVELRTGESAEASWYDPDSVAVYAGNLKQIHRRGQVTLFETRAQDNHIVAVKADSADAISAYLSDAAEQFLSLDSEARSYELTEDIADQLKGLGYTQ